MRRRTHRSVALAQDMIVAEAYDIFPDCVLHGGTAIWRCYRGGRFSEDVDFYLPTGGEQEIRRFRRGVAANGMVELKFKATASTVFAKFSHSETVVSFEAAKRAPPPSVVRPYEMLDGSFALVNTLSPEELIIEKSSAYTGRRKVRDLYDIFFLLNRVEERDRVTAPLARMIREYRAPADEATLKATIIAGAVPSAEVMLGAIERWVERST